MHNTQQLGKHYVRKASISHHRSNSRQGFCCLSDRSTQQKSYTVFETVSWKQLLSSLHSYVFYRQKFIVTVEMPGTFVLHRSYHTKFPRAGKMYPTEFTKKTEQADRLYMIWFWQSKHLLFNKINLTYVRMTYCRPLFWVLKKNRKNEDCCSHY